MKKFFCIALSVLSMAYLPAVGMGVAFSEQGERYYDSGLMVVDEFETVETREVYYSSKDDSDAYENPYKAPTFFAPENSMGCVVNAGGNAMVYFDRIYDDLIPGYSPGYVWGDFSYGSQNDAVSNMFDTLFDMMGTNSSGGTTVSGFKSGITQYTASRGYAVSLTRATGSYHGVNLDLLKSELQAENLAVVFADTLSLTSFSGMVEHDGYDSITHYLKDVRHAMLVYGYKDIYYYNSDGSLKQRDTYLYVFSGYSNIDLGLFDITRFCNIVDIYIVEVI